MTKLACMMAVAAISLAAAGQNPKDLVKPSLIADVKTAAPGQTFHVGLFLRIKPEWHVYWENPGDSGSPTRLRLTLPPGVKAGPVQYPIPKTFKQPGDIVGYGYEDEVMLIAPIRVPADWPIDKPIDIKADAAWLSCKDVCLPGKAKLELTILVAAEAQPDNRSEFLVWSARLPATDSAQLPFKLDGTAESLKLMWSAQPKNVQVLTVSPEGVEVAGTEVKQDGNITAVNNKIRVLEKGQADGASLGLLVLYDDPSGQRRGARLGIPLRGLSSKP
jgi:thiol:disulfide interchange protein DsbD